MKKIYPDGKGKKDKDTPGMGNRPGQKKTPKLGTQKLPMKPGAPKPGRQKLAMSTSAKKEAVSRKMEAFNRDYKKKK